MGSLKYAVVPLLALFGVGCTSLLGSYTVSDNGPADATSDQTGDGPAPDASEGGGPDSTMADADSGSPMDSAADSSRDGAAQDSAPDARTDGGAGGCSIGGTSYANGAINPANACQSCQPAITTAAWIDLPDGTACGGGQVCHAGTCTTGCEIGGSFYPDKTLDPNNPCESCQAATSNVAWTTVSDGTACGNGQTCSKGQCGSQCSIGGTVYAPGQANPTNPCQLCEPGTSTSAWTNAGDGTTCSPGEICAAGTCQSECDIGGTLVSGGTTNSANACQICQPTTSTTSWSNVPDGTGCMTGEICKGGGCAAGCFISGVVYASGAPNPNASGCQSCQPTTSTVVWTNAADGTSCGNGQVCNKGGCGAECDIGGTIYASGAPNPTNACQSCQPGASTSAWTNDSDGTGCMAGEVCQGGTCSAGCFIGGTVYASGTKNVSNSCQSCQPGASTTSWTVSSDGTSCASGEVCQGGTCSSGCFIGGQVYPPGVKNPVSNCQTCQPGVSTTAWSPLPDGTGCANGQVCAGGQCGSQCDIGGTIYSSGKVNPADSCQSCQPGTSTSAWTNSADGTTCASGQVCKGGNCDPLCYIGGAFYTAGQANPGDACQTCQPATSTSAWTSSGDGTSCGSSAICCGGACDTCATPLNAMPICSGGTCSYTCDSGFSACPGGCFNLTNDSKNCGACGRSCGGGTCSTGVCQPWTLATSPNPETVATDGTNVYWTDATADALMQMPILGGAIITLATTPGANMYGASVAKNSVTYFGSPSGPFGVATAGTAGSGATWYATPSNPTFTAVDPSGSYYFVTTQAGTTLSYNVCSSNLGGPGGCKPMQWGAHGMNFAVDGSWAWSTSKAGSGMANVYQWALSGSYTTGYTTYTAGQYVGELASDGSYVYYQYPGSPAGVFRTPTTAPVFMGGTSPIVSGNLTFVTDGINLYWFIYSPTYSIGYTPVGGGTATTISGSGTFGNSGAPNQRSVAGNYLVFINTQTAPTTIAAVAVP